jgi:succinoglycan biosynthesis transport protein ExoP
MDLLNFLKVLLRRKWLILSVTVLAVVVAYLVARIIPPAYWAEAQLATGITDNPEVSLDEDEKKVDHFRSQNRFNNLIELMKSRPVVSLLSYQLILHDLNSKAPFRKLEDAKEYYSDDQINSAKKVFQAKMDSIETINTNNKEEKVLYDLLKWAGYDYESLLENLKVQRVASTDFISVEYTSEDPYLSALVVNTLSQEVIRYYKTIKTDRSFASVEFFEKLAAEKKAELDQKVAILQAFKQDNSVIDLQAQTNNMMGRISSLEVAREETSKQIMSYQQAISNINNRFTGSERNYMEAQASATNQKIIDLKNKINQLNNRYVIAGSQNAALRDSIQALKSQLEAQISNSVYQGTFNPNVPRQELVSRKINSEIELDMAKASLVSIDNELNRLRSEIVDFASKDGALAALQRDVDVAQDAYVSVLNKLTEARFAAQKQRNLLNQVEFGMPADEPLPSKKLLLVAFAGVASFMFCVVLIFVMEYIDTRYKTPSQFQRLTNLRLMGSINELDTKDNMVPEELLASDGTGFKMETYRQSLRKLRYEIETTHPKTVLFTSTRPKEGKTFAMISLAHSLSLNEKKVLLIDTNFKNNSLTQIFGAKPTLERYMNKQVAREDLITRTNLKNIDIIGCLGGDYSPSEVLSHSLFQSLLTSMAADYDYIFMEGASLNSYSDSKELANYSDKIIPVFSADSAVNSSDKASISYLKSLNGKYMGSVLNKVELENLDL